MCNVFNMQFRRHVCRRLRSLSLGRLVNPKIDVNVYINIFLDYIFWITAIIEYVIIEIQAVNLEHIC